MALTAISLPYGLRDVRLRNFTDAAWTTPGTGIDLPFAQTFSFSEAEDFETLRGDDATVTTRGKGPNVDWELDSGGLPLDALKVMAGGTVTTTGVTPNQVKTFRKSTTDVRPYFKAEGQAISDSGGDMHGLVYRCRATDSIDGEFGDGSFWVTKAKGTGLGSFEPGALNALYDFVQNESVTANAP